MSWRLIACRPDGNGSEELITSDIPIKTGTTVTSTLSGPGSMSIKLPMVFKHMIGPDGNPLFAPWGTTIYAERKGVILGGGIVDELHDDDGELEVSVIGHTGYLDGMPFTSEWVGYEVDPLDVARMIWAHVQKQPGGNLGVTLPGYHTKKRLGTRGQPAFRGRPAIYDEKNNLVTAAIPPTAEVKDEPIVYAWHQTSNLLEEFNKLSKSTPFDYAERHAWVEDQIGHHIDIGYPRLGRDRTALRFVPGENVVGNPDVVQHGDLYASEVMLLGAGEGRTKIMGVSNQVRNGRVRRVAVVNEPSVNRADIAKALANVELKHRSGLPNVSDFSVIDHPNAPLGSFGVGDTIMVQSGSGWFEDADTKVRVASITYHVGDSDVADIVAVKEGAS